MSRQNNWTVVAQTNAVQVSNPDFSSANLTCDYDLDVTWHLRCADVKEKVRVYARHVNMYTNIGTQPPKLGPPLFDHEWPREQPQ